MKILSDETNIGTATTVNSATVVRVYNSDSSAGIVTRTDDSNSTIGNFTVPSGEVLYLEKKSTDKLIAPSTVFTSKVAYSSMMHYASYVSPSTYSISQTATSVDEGGNVVYTVTTTNVADGTTLYYSLSGTATAADFNPASLTGSFTISGNSGTFTITIATDAVTDPAETFTASVRTDSTSGTIVATSSQVTITDVPSYSMSQSATAVDEGGNVVYTVTTSGVANGTTLYWSLAGTATAADFDPASLTGSFTISSNTGTFTITIATDAVTDPAETFTASVRTGSTSGTIVATSSQVTITDVVPPESYYSVVFGGNSSEFMSGLAIDGSGNLYSSGYCSSFGPGSYSLLLVKLNEDGVVQWGRSFGTSGQEYTTSEGESVATDSSGNVYMSGRSKSFSPTRAVYAKYNSSGVLQWQRSISQTTDGGVAVDNSDDVYAFGTNYILKSNSSGTEQWQRTTQSTTKWRAAAFDSSDNLHLTGNYGNDLVVTKFNSSGTEQFTRKLSLSSRYLDGRGIGVDSSGNIYVSGSFRPTSGGNNNNGIVFAKWNSSGVLQWNRKLDTASLEDFGDALAIDSSDNIYITGSAGATGSYTPGFVAKYNSSGTIQWQRTFSKSGSPSGNYANGAGMVVDSNNNIYPFFYTSFTGAGGYDGLIFKLPNDGSKTGTYNNIIYGASSVPESAGGFTGSSISSIQTGTSGNTWSTISLTSATETITSTITNIP